MDGTTYKKDNIELTYIIQTIAYMRIVFNTFTIIITVVLLFSCNHDDPVLSDYSKIKGIVHNGNYYDNKIDSVYGIIFYEHNVKNSEIIAKSKFQNGGFYLDLPLLTEDQLPYTIYTRFPDNQVVTANNVKINYLYLRCVSWGYVIGDMFLHNDVERLHSGFIECEYIYCNNPVSIKGSNYDLTFKKGWNLITSSTLSFPGEIYMTSNKIPTGVMWYPAIQTWREPVKLYK